MRRKSPSRETRNVCFVTGTRAEFGLMRSALREINAHARLNLQILVTGMHLDPAHGDGASAIAIEGWKIDRVVSWQSESGRDRAINARNTGLAISGLADAFAELGTDIALVVGDRVEAFATAAAAHLSGIPVAHVHGGDRAAGQVDDSLRHAITKLAHIHFPATRKSAERIMRLGEERWRIFRAGSPGLDGILTAAAKSREVEARVGCLSPDRFALLLLHPIDAHEKLEQQRATLILDCVASAPFEQIVIVYPNNDPGSGGIMRCWETIDAQSQGGRFRVHRDLRRGVYLGLLRDAAVLIGNSSSGIIEAASFGTPVIDIGKRQQGRERGANVTNVPYAKRDIIRELTRIWNRGRPRRFKPHNIYGGDSAGKIIASALDRISINDRLLRKLIRY
jgi:UDP-N-acetylglucosamine 2-epimerase (non-hydrolysing)/GDP/UDP-N,N'-diacetylbacillosamine 2-epimerase (hydrolysing)